MCGPYQATLKLAGVLNTCLCVRVCDVGGLAAPGGGGSTSLCAASVAVCKTSDRLIGSSRDAK